ncbi:hypothetical protein TRFO_25014 [Tritrichomonas foetus]|uniref:Uncharacterized protein n=1 Tax=Tritrichomonas foetus TaxID=1144522 RepID=A0A1J4K660_9EUKA|nr:hypothetical protein TRFO_25014 [Tritrichomonas foetus]|eukprot:OHT06903.1 hypothetical protein TRFO_25014 [Tritrichomonas foetus]
MSEEVLQRFKEIDGKLSTGELTNEEAVAAIKELDFNLLTLDDIEVVEDAEWIPDDLYIEIFRSWTKNQEHNINQICSYLIMHSSIGQDQMMSFIDSVFRPSSSLSLIVENIISKLATGGGVRPYENPVTLGLITASSPNEMPLAKFKLFNLFSDNPSDCFQSTPKPNASFKFSFPPYMKIQPASYTITLPPEKPGPKTWVLQGSNNDTDWTDIADETNSQALGQKGATATFQIEKKLGPFSSFQFINKDLTWAGNQTIALSGFDLSGEVHLVSNRKYEDELIEEDSEEIL